MNVDVKIYVSCGNCAEGTHTKEYAELEKDSFGAERLVTKVGINYVSYDLEPSQLEKQTIAEFVKNKRCRKCQHKALKELIK